MDPIEAIARVVHALLDRDWDEAEENIVDLQIWSKRDGFMPSVEDVADRLGRNH